MQVNQKAAESLADPEEYPNLFEDWQLALDIESKVAETRNNYRPAAEYINYADRSHANLVEAFKNMVVDEEEPLENGDLDHQEVAEHNGDEVEEEEGQEEDGQEEEGQEDGQEEEGQDEGVVVDADSTDGAVLVNGNDADEEWGTNKEGKPSA